MLTCIYSQLTFREGHLQTYKAGNDKIYVRRYQHLITSGTVETPTADTKTGPTTELHSAGVRAFGSRGRR